MLLVLQGQKFLCPVFFSKKAGTGIVAVAVPPSLAVHNRKQALALFFTAKSFFAYFLFKESRN
jgi:hypothetical protein